MLETSFEPKTEQEYKKIFDEMVDFVRSLGLVVNTNTRARGHQGFFLKNRIDISTTIDYQRKIEVMIHEFTHYIHARIEPDISRTHGSLEALFPNADLEKISDEMFAVTRFVDKNKGYRTLLQKKDEISEEIKTLSKEIKEVYPDFKRSEPYKKIEKDIKKTDAKYLLKYDRVCVKTMFSTKTRNYSITGIDADFPEFNKIQKSYLILKSKQRMLKRISGRINRLNNYYKRPTELFARFVEALFVDTNRVSEIAPYTYLVFCKELAQNRYLELADFINKFF